MKITKRTPEDRIVSDEEFDFVTREVIEASEDGEEVTDIEEISDDSEDTDINDYVRDLVDYCSAELEDIVQSFDWDGGSGSFYVTVVTNDDEILDYEIPAKDLKMDISKDTSYILDTIKSDLEVEEGQ